MISKHDDFKCLLHSELLHFIPSAISDIENKNKDISEKMNWLNSFNLAYTKQLVINTLTF